MKGLLNVVRRYSRAALSRAPWSPQRRLQRVLGSVDERTILNHLSLCRWAEQQAASSHSKTDDPLVSSHERWIQELSRYVASSLRGGLTFLAHVPPEHVSIAMASLMGNLLEVMRAVDIEADVLDWDHDLEARLAETRPAILLTTGHEAYLSKLDRDVLAAARSSYGTVLGVAASPADGLGREAAERLIAWSKPLKGGVFFYRWSPPEWADPRYDFYRAEGVPIVTLEYGANPISYRPIGGVQRDLDYVFMGSVHGDKLKRYAEHFGPILKDHAGFLLGPGWPTGPPDTLDRHLHAYLYSRAKVGLNLHIPNQLVLPMQLNERTFNLAAAGVPQVVDRPLLLRDRFTDDAVFASDDPLAYMNNFRLALARPDEAQERARRAHEQVMERRTLFHVIVDLFQQLDDIGIVN